ncbi:hypothetical protein [Lentzea sp. NPDC003310]|uniref:hypothetical protein n=1 Tax=Lentzea sp. NPDC003310 TaxID=3154447 RepID=UPI0033BC0DDD
MTTDTDPTPPDHFACGCVPLLQPEPALPHPRQPATTPEFVTAEEFLAWADDPPWEVFTPHPI